MRWLRTVDDGDVINLDWCSTLRIIELMDCDCDYPESVHHRWNVFAMSEKKDAKDRGYSAAMWLVFAADTREECESWLSALLPALNAAAESPS